MSKWYEKIVDLFKNVKNFIHSILFERNEKKRKIFEMMGIIFFLYYSGKFVYKYIQNKSIESNLEYSIKKYSYPISSRESNWIVVTLVDSNFNINDPIFDIIGRSGLSILFGIQIIYLYNLH